MPANIVSTSAFEQGGIVLTGHAVSVADDGFVEANMDFACRENSLARNMALFQPDLPPPLSTIIGGGNLPGANLPQDLANLRLERGTVFLLGVETTIFAGIANLKARYVGVSAYQKRRVAEVEEIRGFGGRRKFNLFRRDTGASAGFTFGRISFEYTAVVRSVAWAAIGSTSEPDIKGEIKDIRNRNGFTLSTSSNIRAVGVGTGYKVEQYTSLSKTPVGIVTRYAKTAEAVPVTTED